MKLIQDTLPLTLTTTNKIDEDTVYKWVISFGSEKPEITSKSCILDRILCLPSLRKSLINHTELESPFTGKSYVEYENAEKPQL